MNVNLRQFQQNAVDELRMKSAAALGLYNSMHIPQVVSLQAPTGAGKTIIISALMEDIFFGTEKFEEQPNAIFVWLSDSPALNEQSKQKILTKADKIPYGCCETIKDASFDQEMLDDGKIYFLNTQKIGSGKNLISHSDKRTYTIWETIENTVKNKSDRLYFIIDEAHRGMQGKDAGTATSIMQRFIKGSVKHNLSPMPLIIGMSATSQRFNTLVEGTTSGINKVIVTPNDVRASGLLKDRIIITYPDDPDIHNDMSVLQAAVDEWKKKSEHWYMYTYEQHYQNVYPIIVIQVLSATGSSTISDTKLEDVIAKIEERCNITFKQGEVVHTFGSVGNIELSGLIIPHVNPEDINDDRRIRVVLFKENLSTGWDCPRAETMMSFRKAEDATYIAQLLGRMVRTPLGNRVNVDDYLNDVRLYLPYFNRETVAGIVHELQNSEGEDIPTVIDSESLETSTYTTWTTRPTHAKRVSQISGQMTIGDFVKVDESISSTNKSQNTITRSDFLIKYSNNILGGASTDSGIDEKDVVLIPDQPKNVYTPQELSLVSNRNDDNKNLPDEDDFQYEQTKLTLSINREEITKFINQQALISYDVRQQKTYSYLKSLLDLANLITITNVNPSASENIKSDVVEMIHTYIEGLKQGGTYEQKAANVLKFKLLVDVFDVFGNSVKDYVQSGIFDTADSDLDRQLRAAEHKLGSYGFCIAYGNKYYTPEKPNAFKIDCILFAAADDCLSKLNSYAEAKFHILNDTYRREFVKMTDSYLNQYKTIVRNSDKVTKNFFLIPENVQVKEDVAGKSYYNHLFIDDETGAAKIKLNSWEDAVIQEESGRSDFVCWLRNPSRGWGLCIPYEINNQYSSAYPDFLIIRKDSKGDYIIDILEPHMPSLADNLGKAKAFAKYAEMEMHIGRFELIRMEKDSAGKERPKRLDMCKGVVRKKVLQVINNDELNHVFDEEGYFM